METISASEWFVSAKQRDECKGEREGSALQSLSLPLTLEGGGKQTTHISIPLTQPLPPPLTLVQFEMKHTKKNMNVTQKVPCVSMLHLVMDAAC